MARGAFGGIVGGALAVAAGTLAYASLVERNAFTLRRVRVEVLPLDSSELRILHLSDIHMAPWQTAKASWIAALSQLKPDLVVNTGDNLGHPDALPMLRRAFDAFAGTPGVFVNGSNDYFAPELKNPFRYLLGPSRSSESSSRLDTGSLLTYLEQDLHWANLNNNAVDIQCGSQAVEFFGVDDPHRHFDDLPSMSLARASLRGERRRDSHLSIGVTHAPYQRILNAFVREGADIMFAGHTHGGQVRLPGFGALITNCDLPRSMARGLSTWGVGPRPIPLHVSAGLGTSIYAPLRFACRPEATLVTLSPPV